MYSIQQQLIECITVIVMIMIISDIIYKIRTRMNDIEQISQVQQSKQSSKFEKSQIDNKQTSKQLKKQDQNKEQMLISYNNSRQLEKSTSKKSDLQQKEKGSTSKNKTVENKKELVSSDIKPDSNKKVLVKGSPSLVKGSASIAKNQVKDKQIGSDKKIQQKKNVGKEVGGQSSTKAINKNVQVKKGKQQPAKQTIIKKPTNVELPEVEIELSSDSFTPLQPNVSLIGVLQNKSIIDPNLIKYYTTSKKYFKFVIQPIISYMKQQSSGEEKNDSELVQPNMLFSTQILLKYEDEVGKYQNTVIYYWIVQLFYEFYLEAKNGCFGFAQIQKSCVYVTESPFLKPLMQKKNEYMWDNPLRLLLTGTVTDQVAYISQIPAFGSQFGNIKNLSDLKNEYIRIKYDSYFNELISIKNVSVKLRDKLVSLSNSKNNDDKKNGLQGADEVSILTQDMIKWVSMQVSQNINSKLTLYYKGSSCGFEPLKFWQTIYSNMKPTQSSQLMVIEMEMETRQKKLIGFYSNKFNHGIGQNKQIFGQYVVDSQKKSLLFNFGQKTVHHLNDTSHAFMYNNQVLLCVGKCDVVLSAFNITNLCYFPVSYSPDNEGICQTAEALCGSKKFKVKEIYVYKFNTVQ